MQIARHAPIIPAAKLREIAVRAQADPRTIVKILNGVPSPRGEQIVRGRIRQALVDLGYGNLIGGA